MLRRFRIGSSFNHRGVAAIKALQSARFAAASSSFNTP
jgi:hypothetical protein